MGAVFIIALILINSISYLHLCNAIGQTSEKYADFVQEGVASWYGPGFHGRKTASGEKFDTHDLTAAHKSLPFNTYLRVTNLENGKSTIVRVNDRGPYSRGRIIDLSMAAKQEIEMGGLAQVRIEVYYPESENLNDLVENPVTSTLFEDVIPSTSKVFLEFDNSRYSEYRDILMDNFNLFIHTFKKINIIVLATSDADAEKSLKNHIKLDRNQYFDITSDIKSLKGFTYEILNTGDFSDLNELVELLESSKFETVFIVQVKSADSTNIKVLVGDYTSELDSYKDKKMMEDMKLKVRLVKF